MPRHTADSDDSEPLPSGAQVRIYADIKVMKSNFEALDRRLFGNGQPGEIQKLWGEVDELKKVYYRVAGVAIGAMTVTKVLFDFALPSLVESVRHLAK